MDHVGDAYPNPPAGGGLHRSPGAPAGDGPLAGTITDHPSPYARPGASNGLAVAGHVGGIVAPGSSCRW